MSRSAPKNMNLIVLTDTLCHLKLCRNSIPILFTVSNNAMIHIKPGDSSLHTDVVKSERHMCTKLLTCPTVSYTLLNLASCHQIVPYPPQGHFLLKGI